MPVGSLVCLKVPNNKVREIFSDFILELFEEKIAEDGDGYCDIQAEIEDEGIGIIIEVKYAEGGNFDAACRAALNQINDNSPFFLPSFLFEVWGADDDIIINIQ